MNRSDQNTFASIEHQQYLLEFTLTWFEVIGYDVLLQADITSGRHQTILRSYCNGVLGSRFREAMGRINPHASPGQIESALKELTKVSSLPMLQQNYLWHNCVLNGIEVASSANSAFAPATTLQLIDFTALSKNDWLVIQGFPALKEDYSHCLDLVVFVNGLPLVVFGGLFLEDREWSLRTAYSQLQEWTSNLPHFFAFNELMVVSNGLRSRIGTLTTAWKQFIAIRSTIGGKTSHLPAETQMVTLLTEVFDKRRFLEILRHFIVFSCESTGIKKRLRPHGFCNVIVP
jgi:type I restriction enzyme R subunit